VELGSGVGVGVGLGVELGSGVGVGVGVGTGVDDGVGVDDALDELDVASHSKPQAEQLQQPPERSGLPDLYTTVESLLML
jgi:hypothetical protein